VKKTKKVYSCYLFDGLFVTCTEKTKKKHKKMNNCISKSTRIFQRIIAPLTFTVVFLFSACTSDKQTEALLERAQSVMEASPDSAFHILDSIAPFMAEKAENLRMRHLMLSSQAQNKLIIPFTTDSTMKVVVKYYDHHGSPNDRMLAHYLLGCTYRDMDKYEKALNTYHNALQCADTLDADCDFTTYYSIYGQIASIYRKNHIPEKELVAFNKYSYYALKAKDTLNYINGIQLTISTYYVLRDLDKMFKATDKASSLYTAIGRKDKAAKAYYTAIHTLIVNEQYDQASELMAVYERESDIFDQKGDITDRRAEQYYYSQGLLALGKGNIKRAEERFRKLNPDRFPTERAKGLMQLYQQLNNPDSVSKYSTIYSESVVNRYDTVRTEILEKTNTLDNNLRTNKTIEAYRLKNDWHKGILITIIVLVLILFLVIYMIYRKKSNEYTEKTQEMQDKIDTIKSELEDKNKDCIDISNQLAVIKNNKDINEVFTDSFVEEIRRRFDPVSSLKKQSEELTKDEWNSIEQIIKYKVPRLYELMNVKFCITDNEKRVCILVFLNFKNDETARLMKKQSSYISKVKSKLCRKFFNIEDTYLFRRYLLNYIKSEV